MHIEDMLAGLSFIGLIVIYIWLQLEKKKLIHFFDDLTDKKNGKTH